MAATDQSIDGGQLIPQKDIDDVRRMIGEKLRIDQWNHQASIDNIRHYAHGLGDDNPLWCDEAYAAASPHGSIVAPPTFPYAVWPAGIGCGLPRLRVLHAGGRWDIKRYFRPGDRINVDARLVDVKELNGKRAGQMLLQIGKVIYSTDQGEVIAEHESRTFRVPEPKDGGKLNYAPSDQRWTEAQLADMEAEVLKQTRRGSKPLLFDSVSVGDAIPGRLKGPLNMQTMIAYYAGNLGGLLATDMQVRNRELCMTRPDLAPNNRPVELRVRRATSGEGHHDASSAASLGMPGIYDNGWMRIGWMQQMLTDWIGDHGILVMLDASIVLPNVIGDTLRFNGSVTGKREGGLVDVQLWGERQDGAVSCKGFGTVRLPLSTPEVAS